LPVPEPSWRDVFVRLGRDPFVGEKGVAVSGWVCGADVPGELKYEKAMGFNREGGERKKGFEWLVDEIIAAPGSEPEDARVSLRGPTSPESVEKLDGMSATRGRRGLTDGCRGGNGRRYCIRLKAKVFERAWRSTR